MVTLSPGSTFLGRYEVVRRLKAGGMGAIYEVVHLETKRRRALKLMLPGLFATKDMLARFQLEATIAADIESEHIVETFDAGVDPESGVPFLVMELLRGEDLAALLERRRRLPASDVVTLLDQTARALDKIHAAGVVHRDLKPENLFVARRDDGAPKIKILDFGIAKMVAEAGQPAAKTRVLGTPIYMSPEQVRGDGAIGPAADRYSLAQIAFTLLVGRAYWSEESDKLPMYALMTKVVGGGEVPAGERARAYGGEVPEAFAAWFERATRVMPGERFASASEMVSALGRALGVGPATTSSPFLDEPAARPSAPSAPGTGAETEASLPSLSSLPTLELARSRAPVITESPQSLAARPEPAPSARSRWVVVALGAAGLVSAGVLIVPRLAGSPEVTGPAAGASPPSSLPSAERSVASTAPGLPAPPPSVVPSASAPVAASASASPSAGKPPAAPAPSHARPAGKPRGPSID